MILRLLGLVVTVCVLLVAAPFACRRVEQPTPPPDASPDKSPAALPDDAALPAIDLDTLEPPLARSVRTAVTHVRATPRRADAWGALGELLLVHDLIPEAVACLQRAATLDPTAFRWPYLLGRAALLEDQQAVCDHFTRAARIRGDSAPLHVHLGRCSFLLGELERARQHLERALQLDDTLVRANLGLGQIALQQGDVDTALARLEAAWAQGGRSAELAWALAETHRLAGRGEQSAQFAAAARAATDLLEPLPDPLYNAITRARGVTLRWRSTRSRAHELAGRPDKAVQEWEAAARADAGWAPVHAQLGLTCMRAGRPAQAIEAFRRTLEIDPQQPRIRNSLGAALVSTGRIDEGLEMLKRSCAELPHDADALCNLGIALRDAGRTAEAKETLERAAGLDPAHGRVWLELGLLHETSGRLAAAADAFERATTHAPEAADAYVAGARVLTTLGRTPQAVALLERGRVARPADATLARLLAWSLATSPDERVRDGSAAVELIAPLCEATRYQDPALVDVLAAAYAEAGDFDAAERTVSRAIDTLRPRAVTRRVQAALAEMEARRELYRRGQPYRE